MGAADPSYPLLPTAYCVSAVLLLLVLLTSFVRRSWNLGVTFLCFWRFLEIVMQAVDTIAWSDNDTIKFHAYCDLGKCFFCLREPEPTL